jgi:hypothetical protein
MINTDRDTKTKSLSYSKRGNSIIHFVKIDIDNFITINWYGIELTNRF